LSFLTRTDPQLEILYKAEEAIYKRDFTQAQRKKLAAEGKALPNLSYPIDSQADLHPAAVLARSGHGDTAAAKALIARRAKELGASNPLKDDEDEKMEKAEFVYDSPVPLWKDDKKHLVYTVFLQPEVPDSQGDRIGTEEIHKTAHRWMVESRKTDVQHDEVPANERITPVETYLAPVDFQVKDPLGREHKVLKGSWIVVSKCMDPDVWDLVEKGEGGGSIGGSGYRTPD
jgi:hypothetical protein